MLKIKIKIGTGCPRTGRYFYLIGFRIVHILSTLKRVEFQGECYTLQGTNYFSISYELFEKISLNLDI